MQYIVTKVSLELGAFIFAQDKLAASVVKREPVNHMGMMMIKAGRSSSKNRTVRKEVFYLTTHSTHFIFTDIRCQAYGKGLLK